MKYILLDSFSTPTLYFLCETWPDCYSRGLSKYCLQPLQKSTSISWKWNTFSEVGKHKYLFHTWMVIESGLESLYILLVLFLSKSKNWVGRP